jgi:hypothetical protein
VNKMKKHIELFNKFGRRFAIAADCGEGNIEVDFYEISSGRYGMEISKVVVQHAIDDENKVNIIDYGVVDVSRVGDIFEYIEAIPLSGDAVDSEVLRKLFSYSTELRDYVFGEIEISDERSRYLESAVRKIFVWLDKYLFQEAP